MAEADSSIRDKLLSRLLGPLDLATADGLIEALLREASSTEHGMAAGRAPIFAVIHLLDELHDLSSKVTRLAIEALSELHRRAGLSAVVPWLDVGVALAGSSGAAAMKYFKESPLLVSLVEPVSAREPLLGMALELAEADPNVALEFVRRSPELVTALPASELPAWAEVGLELARWDYVLGIEYFRQLPAVARVLQIDQIRPWVAFGMKLITRNSLGKTDYLGTLEFFRTSPAILGDIGERTVRARVVEFGSALADHSPEIAVTFLSEAPGLLRRMPSEEWRLRIFRYGMLVAERDPDAALAYVRRCPEILALVGNTGQAVETFEEWYRGGMEVLEYSADGARAYFSLETKKALESVQKAMSAVPLRQIARSLKLFAQGLCGSEVQIQSLPTLVGGSANTLPRPTVGSDGRTIMLPAILQVYPTRERNVRLYTIMTAHEAGHLEFGTYDLPLERLRDLIGAVCARYGRQDAQAIETLADLFERYPQPGLMRDLWTVLEDARVEHRLRHDYPGLRDDLAAFAREAVRTRSWLHGLTIRELVVDTLLLLTTSEPGTVRVSESIQEVVERIWARCQTILTPVATAEDVVRLADQIYVELEHLPEAELPAFPEQEPAPELDQGAGPPASEAMSGQYRPVTNWAYRGDMNPELVRSRGAEDWDQTAADSDERMAGLGSSGTEPPRQLHPSRSMPDASRQGQASGLLSGERSERESSSLIEEWLALEEVGRQERVPEPLSGTATVYDEWDGRIQDYRTGWCRVVERPASEGGAEFVDGILAEHGAEIRLLRRYFESLRPTGLRRLLGQLDGEELDLDAAIVRAVDRLAGVDPSDRIYARRQKREREVAAAFLVDLSGSTSRQIDSSGRCVIDVEKEGLVLLCEALEAIGDQYAVYGYSGQGRRQVDFLVFKEFDEPGRRVAYRLGSIAAMQQNRDGAAIRHATRKLLKRDARVRLLVLLSDGRPLDDGYADEYSLEDTKMALREARMRGIEPFCITVDRTADDYLKRMYGEVRYLVIDQVGALPERLPRIYHRLTA